MNIIHAQFQIVPGKEAEAEAAMKAMAAAVEAKEAGALTYIFHRSRKEPLAISVWEVYADDEAFATHGASEYMATFRTYFGTLFDPATVKIERLERVAGFAR